MHHQATRRALAATYGIVAAIQLYLAVTTGAGWAWTLTALCATVAAGFGAAFLHGRRAAARAAAADPDLVREFDHA
ncbi:hypothetical protein ACGFMK_29885 [Amycolatopsis sp. NPDC049252]|uniref:hypothetical protein n=1 Tax=Amycolatopsis sp. NPDC049252 TaxID=3363933 RepID=UPI003717FD33